MLDNNRFRRQIVRWGVATFMATYKVQWVKKERGLEHADELMKRVESILNTHAADGFELDQLVPSINNASSDLLGVFLILKHA